jgi:hypothetical protein
VVCIKTGTQCISKCPLLNPEDGNKNENFAQGRMTLAEFTPKFQMGLFFENGLKLAVCHFCAFQFILQGLIIPCF